MIDYLRFNVEDDESKAKETTIIKMISRSIGKTQAFFAKLIGIHDTEILVQWLRERLLVNFHSRGMFLICKKSMQKFVPYKAVTMKR